MASHWEQLLKPEHYSHFLDETQSLVDLHSTFHHLGESLTTNPAGSRDMTVSLLHSLSGVVPDIDRIVNNVPLEVEPKNAVVRLGVDASQLRLVHEVVELGLIRALDDVTSSHHLDERVSVLGSKLDGEVQVLDAFIDVVEWVGFAVAQVDPGTLTPHFA